ncbi:hypothetical protein K3152_00860 [Qipengyuania sp. 1NDH17]|uniref:Uncharacterized protein n=1 Tax=Qipengyuania polymorpha TaxID=2867234 RepID=A0ABS7ITV2_9SPHN|nr:hypothetical protein [Qipengyuania polymorpha]MBX7456787.1 hypothetical protein [Qipengyuania polymorpha]
MAVTAIDKVSEDVGFDEVVAVATIKGAAAASTDDVIIAAAAVDVVGTTAVDEAVVIGTADDLIVAGREVEFELLEISDNRAV